MKKCVPVFDTVYFVRPFKNAIGIDWRNKKIIYAAILFQYKLLSWNDKA